VLSVVRGLASSALELSTLAQGYVTSKQRLGWPGGIFGSSLDGGGALRVISGTTPAAGANISETVPTGARWELLAVHFLFTTSAAVANRVVALGFNNGGQVYQYFMNQQNQAASLGWEYVFGQGLPALNAGSLLVAIAGLAVGNRLLAGDLIQTFTAAIQAADQFSQVRLVVREWIEGA